MGPFDFQEWRTWVSSLTLRPAARLQQPSIGAALPPARGLTPADVGAIDTQDALRQVMDLKRLREEAEDEAEAEAERDAYLASEEKAADPPEGKAAKADAARAPQGPLPGQRTKAERPATRPSLRVELGGALGYADKRWSQSGGWQVVGVVRRLDDPKAKHATGALVRARQTGTYYQVNGDSVLPLDRREVLRALGR